MGKEKSGKSFSINDLVFAKVKGYPAWPAKITKYINKKYNVYFYGTGETANIKIEDLFPYVENKEKFATDKNMKRAKFSEAMDQIESALKGEDSAPIDLSNPDDGGADEQTSATETPIPSKNPTPIEVPTPTPEAAETSAADASSVGNSSTQKKAAGSRKSKGAPKHVDGDSEEAGTDSADGPPPQKRRVPPEGIAATSTPPPAANSSLAKKTVKKSKPTAAVTPIQKRSRPANNKENDLLMVYMPTAKCLGIDINYNKPERFESAAAEQSWIDKSRNEAYDLKLKLESGQLDPDSLPGRIIIEPTRNEIPKQEAARFIEEIIEHEDALFMERDFIQLSQQLRECLGLRRANVGKCLEILDQFKDVELTKLMLLRNPECVDIMRRLRRYVGNLDLWKMDYSDEVEFKEKAQIIRKVSSTIYDGFKSLFNSASEEDNFWMEFCEKVKIYKSYTKNVNENLRVSMNERGYNSLVEAKQGNIPATAKKD
ncbi:GL14025 [Drosophila persimilis]|uniref:PC4 and SFRS1-interacting protein n=2 Tax=pseudoobscura subgroup TaxID=32358 RepID=A0A6I8VVY0_DROPS|nr:PC4 and SFRS1-interacting protein [Drosophila persimilis]XP_033235108.1 PC4 and SFRS1-interacting protein [Drosophila pseudoobscura]EDW39310.1 GL14025 [Drosophila persimilis]